MQIFTIPSKPSQSQRLRVQLGALFYVLVLVWNEIAQCWVLNILNDDDVPLLNGVPLVTGTDLLEQYGYLQIPGRLIVQTDNAPNEVPTYDNLGLTGHLYYLVD